MIKRFLLRLLPATTILLTILMLPAGNGVGASTSGKMAGEATAVAQMTATPAAYPSPGGEGASTATAAPGEAVPSPDAAYPAGVEIDGTDRAGGDEQTIVGDQAESDEGGGADEEAQIEQRGLGSFILWLAFIFGFVVFVAGIFFSIFLSTRDRRSEL